MTAAATDVYTLSLHDALPIYTGRLTDEVARQARRRPSRSLRGSYSARSEREGRSEEHTSELQSRREVVCRLLLVKKKPQLDVSPLVADAMAASSLPLHPEDLP